MVAWPPGIGVVRCRSVSGLSILASICALVNPITPPSRGRRSPPPARAAIAFFGQRDAPNDPVVRVDDALERVAGQLLSRAGVVTRSTNQGGNGVHTAFTKAKDVNNAFALFAAAVNRFVSSPAATGSAFLVVVVWALFGPATHYSNGWQLLINTGTTIVTFLMVFVLNNAQNRDTTAMNVKLDALIKAIEKADNRLIGLESLPPNEAQEITAEIRADAP